MRPLSPQQKASERLLSALPVRTHYQPAPKQSGNIHFMTPIQASERKLRIRKMYRDGKSRREIAAIERCTVMTVHNHLRQR